MFIKHLILFGAKPPGRQAIYGDAVMAPVIGEAHCQLANAATAGPVRCETSVTRNAGDGADVDDAPILTRNHAARHGLRHEKTSAKICVEDEIPIVPGYVERGFAHVASRVVHENIEMAEFLCGCRSHAIDAF